MHHRSGSHYIKWGKIYQSRFMTDNHFEAVDIIQKACEKHNISQTTAALTWITNHSKLNASDALIIGASKLEQLEENLTALERKDDLPSGILTAYDQAWKLVESVCPSYQRGYSGMDM